MKNVKTKFLAVVLTISGLVLGGCVSTADYDALKTDVQNAKIMAKAAQLQAQANATALKALKK